MNAHSKDQPKWTLESLETPAGPVLQVSTKLRWRDYLGTVRIRLNILRMSYSVEPGLYAVGSPTPESPVFVSANYKLSFDHLRQELAGIDGWILVLDTKGINVWCAAGKGTFGTDEIVERVGSTALEKVVSHRRLIVPQLGAPGVAAHEVKKQTGFRVVYGPVRARDIRAFLDADMKATPEMRHVHFDLIDRMAIIPVDIVQSCKYAILIAAGLFLLSGLGRHGYSFAIALSEGTRAVSMVVLGMVVSPAFVPILLPWLPGRAFSVKGFSVAVVTLVILFLAGALPVGALDDKLDTAGWALMVPAAVSFVGMNFTGASTFTSLSGVKKEMRYSVPIQIAAAVTGLLLWAGAKFV